MDTTKCYPSPTGAHHWMLPGTGVVIKGPCKYCGTMSRRFRGAFETEDWSKQKAHTQVIRRSAKLAGQFEPLPNH